MKRVICICLAAVLAVTALAGCNKPEEDLHAAVTYDTFPTALTAYKVGTMPRSGTPAAGGLYYAEGGKYGILSHDGTHDSGAVYAVCRPLGNYFLVAKSTGNTIKTMNTAGVVDAMGNVLVPLEYASVVALDDRFAMAAELTGFTDSKDQSVTSRTDNNGEKTYYTGNWYLYDLTTGRRIPNATGTRNYAAYSYGGQYLKYVTDDKVQHVVTPEGEPLPAAAVHLNNGYYLIEAENALYNGAGTKLFTYDPNGYIPCNGEDVSGYIVAKKTVDGTDTYVLMDETGAVLTAPLPAKPKTCGELLLVDKKVYNNKGELLLEGEFTSAYNDPVTKQCWLLSSSSTKEKVLVDGSGKVLYRSADEDVKFIVNHFSLYKKVGDEDQYPYVIARGDFGDKATPVAPWLLRTTAEDGTVSLVDAISGNTLLSGHTAYSTALIAGDRLYVYATDAEGTVELYRIK